MAAEIIELFPKKEERELSLEYRMGVILGKQELFLQLPLGWRASQVGLDLWEGIKSEAELIIREGQAKIDENNKEIEESCKELAKTDRWKDVYQRNKQELDKLDACVEALSHEHLSDEKEKKLKRRYNQIQRLREKMQWLEKYGETNLDLEYACSRSNSFEHEMELIKKAINKLKE